MKNLQHKPTQKEAKQQEIKKMKEQRGKLVKNNSYIKK